MKKVLVLVLSLVFVVAMASVTFAVATTSVDGEVYVEWTNTAAFDGYEAGYINFDLTKDFGEGFKAGVGIDADPSVVFNAGNEVYFDCAGWIEWTQEMFVATASTSIDGNASKYDLGGGWDLTAAPGVKVVSTALMEGLTGTFIVNDGSVDYNFLLKADYVGEALGAGFGYQAGPDAMYVWGSYKVMDSLTVNGEYGMRTDLSAMEVAVAYSADPLTANAKFIMTTADGYVFVDEAYENVYNAFGEDGVQGSIVVADATYKLSDAISVNGAFGYAMVDTWADNQLMSFEVGATDKLSDKLTVEGSLTSYADVMIIDVCATYTFVEGLVGTLEVVNETNADTTFTASIDATDRKSVV